MSFIKVMSKDADVKTHGVVDGKFLDLFNPASLPGDTATQVLKLSIAAAAGIFGTRYALSGSAKTAIGFGKIEVVKPAPVQPQLAY